MASGSATVRNGQDRSSAYGHAAVRKFLGNGLLHNQLRAVHFHRRQEFAVRQLRQALCLSAYSYEVVYVLFALFVIKFMAIPQAAARIPHELAG